MRLLNALVVVYWEGQPGEKRSNFIDSNSLRGSFGGTGSNWSWWLAGDASVRWGHSPIGASVHVRQGPIYFGSQSIISTFG